MGILRSLLDDIKAKVGSAVVLLGAKDSSKASLVCGVTDDLVKKGYSAAELIKRIAGMIKGSGGGRPDMAQAGGADTGNLDKAIGDFFKVIEEGMTK
jgi:alanyl-tRNA synthetase